MSRKIALIFIPITILLLCASCGNREIEDRYYSDYAQLGKSNEPGNWIPPFIPHSALEIKAKYKIDTGAELLTFLFKERKNLIVAGQCTEITISEIELPTPEFLSVTWWPD